MRSLVLALFSLSAALAAGPASAAPAAAEARPLTLGALVDLAVRGNPTLGMARADAAVAAGNLYAARGLDDALLDASASWSEARQALVGGVPVQQPATDDIRLGLGLTQPLPTGGRLALKLGAEYLRSDYVSALDTGSSRSTTQQWTPTLTLTLTHSLLRGVGIQVARAPRRKARLAVDAASLARESVASGILRDVVAGYWELVYARRQLDIRQDLLRAGRDMLRAVTANIEVGKQPPSAAAEVEVAIAERDDDVLAAEAELTQRSVELGRLVGLDLDGATPTWTAAAPGGGPGARDGNDDGALPVPRLGQSLEAARLRNPDLLGARLGERLAGVDVEVARNGRLPLLDVSVGGGLTGAASNLGTALTQFGQAQPSYTVSASLVFQQPIPNRAARGAYAAAQASARKSEHNETAVRQQVEAQAVTQVAAAAAAAARLERLRPSTASAARDLDAERARFAVGRATNFDVLRRQDEVAQVQLRQARARADYFKAMAALDALTGDLLPRLGVTLTQGSSR